MFIGYLYFFNSGSRLLFFLKNVIFIFGGGASIAFVHINYLPTRNQLRTCMFFIIICFNVIFSILVWNYMRTKHSFCHFYSQHHSLNNLPTPYQGDTCMSEAANYPKIAVLPYSLEAEPLICGWADSHMTILVFQPPAVRGGQALSLSLSKDICRLWSQTEEQTGFHHARMEGRRALLSSIYSLPWQGERNLGTYRVTPFPAFCRDEMFEIKLLFLFKNITYKIILSDFVKCNG